MPKETEIKLRVHHLPELRRVLKKLRARTAAGRVHERNVVFDTPGGDLAKREQLLRIRTETAASSRGTRARGVQRVLVTFKRPLEPGAIRARNERHKIRHEIELEVSDGTAMAMIFEGLGLRPSFRYEKFRTTFRLPGSLTWASRLLIELDETPIGVFLELEGPARAIDRASAALRFEKSDYILANYMVLYREYCRRTGKQPTDMLFAKKRETAGRAKSKNV